MEAENPSSATQPTSQCLEIPKERLSKNTFDKSGLIEGAKLAFARAFGPGVGLGLGVGLGRAPAQRGVSSSPSVSDAASVSASASVWGRATRGSETAGGGKLRPYGFEALRSRNPR